MRLDPAAAAAGFRLLDQDVLPSTNLEALALARHGDDVRVWVVARRQTAGRGRGGREWVSPPGNLYATLLLLDPAPAEIAPQLAFVAGLAVCDAIVDCARNFANKLALKWPNDVLHDGRKLAGILIESEAAGARLAVATGIGINCERHPERTAFPATDLAEACRSVSPETLFCALSRRMMHRLDQWNRGKGFPLIRGEWLDRAAGLGSEVAVRLAGRELRGAFERLDEAGRLLLRLPEGTLKTIAAGDVFPVARGAPLNSSLDQKGQAD